MLPETGVVAETGIIAVVNALSIKAVMSRTERYSRGHMTLASCHYS